MSGSFLQASRAFGTSRPTANGDGDDDEDDDDEEGEEEQEEEDESVEAGDKGYETDATKKPSGAEDTTSSEPRTSSASSVAEAAKDDGSGVGEVPLDSEEDAQAPKKRFRSKSSLATLPSTAVLGASAVKIQTPASYTAALPTAEEEELQQVLQQIALEEGGGDMSPEIARHEALLMRMGTPERASKPEGPIRDSNPPPRSPCPTIAIKVCHPQLPVADIAGGIVPDCKRKLDFGDDNPAWKQPPDQEHWASV